MLLGCLFWVFLKEMLQEVCAEMRKGPRRWDLERLPFFHPVLPHLCFQITHNKTPSKMEMTTVPQILMSEFCEWNEIMCSKGFWKSKIPILT